MPIFGKRSQAYELTGRERPGVGGQVLNQIGMNLFGVDVEGMKLNRAMAEKQREFMTQLAGRLRPEYAPTNNELTVGLNGEGNASTWSPEASINPVRTADPLNINSPELALLRMRGDQLGYDMSGITDVLKAQQPDWKIGPDGRPYNAKASGGLPERFRNPTNVNGWVADLNNPENEGQYFPTLPSGVIPNSKGGVANIGGLTPALQEQSEAETLGRTRGTMLNVPRPPRMGGGTGLMTGAQYLGTEGAPGAQSSGFGVAPAPADQAYDAVLAKDDAARFEGILTAANTARSVRSNLIQMSNLLKNVNTGSLTPVGREIASAMTSLGMDVNPDWNAVQAAEAIANKLVLDFAGGSLGTGIATSDRTFIEKMGPQVTQTPQGRQIIIDFAIKKADRDIQVGQMARQWQQKVGRLDRPDVNGRSFYDYLDQWAEQNPLVTRAP
jgi:hypothetical protein